MDYLNKNLKIMNKEPKKMNGLKIIHGLMMKTKNTKYTLGMEMLHLNYIQLMFQVTMEEKIN